MGEREKMRMERKGKVRGEQLADWTSKPPDSLCIAHTHSWTPQSSRKKGTTENTL